MTSLKPCDAGAYEFSREGDCAKGQCVTRIEDCLECQGTGMVRTRCDENGRSYDVASPCPRRRLARRLEIFDAARLPAVHAPSSFDNFKAYGEAQASALALAREFCGRWPQMRGFVLSGPVGTGKTHLLTAALKHLSVELGVGVAYIEISLLFATIRRGFQDGKSGGEIIGPLSQVELLAIDELGKGRGSPFEMETLDELIARRYNAKKTTLFATNYSLRPPEAAKSGFTRTEDLVESAKDSRLLCDRVGERIYSRLCEMCELVEFPPETKDLRRAKAAKESSWR